MKEVHAEAAFPPCPPYSQGHTFFWGGGLVMLTIQDFSTRYERRKSNELILTCVEVFHWTPHLLPTM